jgi:hypothetical protein
MADWLEPYHDYARPPPAVVLAEAAKHSELKTGHPWKGVDLTVLNGLSANGNGKKDEEPPAVTDPPELVVKFFDGEKISSFVVPTLNATFPRNQRMPIDCFQRLFTIHCAPCCHSCSGGMALLQLKTIG